MKKMSGLDWLSWILLVIGGLNWGLVGLFDLDVIAKIFAGAPVVAMIIYILVGLSAIWSLVCMNKMKNGSM